MSAAGVIVVDVLSQDSPEVPFVEDDHVVETLAANATNHPFDVRILPWRARRRPNLVDAESRDAPAEVRSIDSISVSQMPWCTTPIEADSSLGPDSHHPIISLSGIPSAVMVLRILHPIRASTLCAANPLARIAEPTIAL